MIIPLFQGFGKDAFGRLGRGLRREGRKQDLLHLPNGSGILRLRKCGGYLKSVDGKNGIRL